MKKVKIFKLLSLVLAIIVLLPTLLVTTSAALYPSSSCYKSWYEYSYFSGGKETVALYHTSIKNSATEHYIQSLYRIDTYSYPVYDEFEFYTWGSVVYTAGAWARGSGCNSDTIFIGSNSSYHTNTEEFGPNILYYLRTMTENGITYIDPWVNQINGYAEVYHYYDGNLDWEGNSYIVNTHSNNYPNTTSSQFWITYHDYA